MPLLTYKIAHSESKLTDEERGNLIAFFKTLKGKRCFLDRNQNLINETSDIEFKASNEFLEYVISPEKEVSSNIFEKIHIPGSFFSEKLNSNPLS